MKPVFNPIPRKEFVDQFMKHICQVMDVEYIDIKDADGRIVAEDLCARNTLPVCRSATGDSVAMKSSAFENGTPDASEWIPGVEYVRADHGDDFPDEYDCITRVESVEFLPNGGLRFVADPVPFGKIAKRGSNMMRGEHLVNAGTVLTPMLTALLASGGYKHIPVRRKVKIAFIPTGNELIPAGQLVNRGQIPDSNSYLMEMLIRRAGAEPVMFPIIRDSKEALANALKEARKMSDLVLINGGSSKGSEDYNAVLLSERADYYQHGVMMAPGKVAAVAVIDGVPHINLPGPSIAAAVTWEWLVRPTIAELKGIPLEERKKIRAFVPPEEEEEKTCKKADSCSKALTCKKIGKMEKKEKAGSKAPFEYMRLMTVKEENGRLIAYPMDRTKGMKNAMGVNAYLIQQSKNDACEGDVELFELW